MQRPPAHSAAFVPDFQIQPVHFGALGHAAHSEPAAPMPDPSQPLQIEELAQSNLPSHFAPPMHGAPPSLLSAPRSSELPAPLRTSVAPASDARPMAPPEPGAVMAASVFLGLPLALATLVVAVLALR